MAVKKHELVHDNRSQLDLNALVKYIQLMNVQPNYLPLPHDLVKNCLDIVKCLARATGNEEKLWNHIQAVEDFLLRVVNSVHDDMRHEIVTAILDKFYSYISDPQSDACPATSIVLIVLDVTDNEATLSAARWLVQQGENGPAGAGLRASLSCLYCWMYQWHGTPGLGDWVIAFIKALEENERFDILIEVSVDNLGRLFSAMAQPSAMRQSVADVILHMLASLRESTEALDRISPHVRNVLSNLATDSGQFSRQLLQNVVDVVSAMLAHIIESLKGEAQDMFKDKYADVIQCLERHMASRGCRFLQLPAWRARNVCLTSLSTNAPMRKVGLLNLGNTCYMNSVMQALLVTRLFSTHVMLRMAAVPYWAKMGILFAKMMHSIATKLNPDEFFVVVKPPFFTTDHQHDSSEFLGYLFELLQSFEHCSDRDFDYSRPAVLTPAGRWRVASYAHASSPPHTSSENDAEPTAANRRSVSPRPGGSGSGSISSNMNNNNNNNISANNNNNNNSANNNSNNNNKRSSSEIDATPPRKRIRVNESAFLRRDSFVDSMFGGVLLTRVECTECHSSSLSRDVFRDLTLAFPEKPEGWQYTVQSLLEYYCSKERMSGDNQYECRDCGGLRDAERSVLIETTPKYLILVLKNFKFEPKLQVQTKLMHSMYYNHSVTLPTVRTMTEHATYALYAAIIHAGTTLDSGHYYTLAKDNDQWNLYNDDVVSSADETMLGSGLNRASTPYLLFYRRTDVEEGTAPSLEDLPPKLQESVMAHNKHYVETVRKMRLTRP